MIETRLILIEGLSGSGKSTTAQHLCLHLRKLGHDAEWIYEHETPHPIYPQEMVQQALAGNAGNANNSSAGLLDDGLENWRKLGSRLQDDRSIAVVDGPLFQTAVGLLLAMDVAPDTVLRHVLQVQEAIKPCAPVMVYFYQSDFRRTVARIRQVRGVPYDEYCVARLKDTPYGRRNSIHDMEGVLEFFELQRQITDWIFEKLDIARLPIENSSGEWQAYRDRIAEFLSIPPIEDPYRKVESAGDFAGTYRHAESGDELTILVDGQELFLADESRTRLIPNLNDTFHVEGMCIDVAFRRSGRESVVRAELTGNLPNLGKYWVKV